MRAVWFSYACKLTNDLAFRVCENVILVHVQVKLVVVVVIYGVPK